MITPTSAAAPCAVEAMSELAATDVSGCDRDELDRVVMLGRRVRSALDTIDVQVARRSDHLCDQGHGDPAPVVLGDGGRRGAREARAAAKRAKICDQLPALEAALADGEVTAAHVDAVAQLAEGLDEHSSERLAGLAEALVADAARQPISTFERGCRELKDQLSVDGAVDRFERQRAATNVRKWINATTGMYHVHAELDPESGASVFVAVDAHTATLRKRSDHNAPAPAQVPLERVEADAFVELITCASSVDRRVPEVSVLIDYHTLLNGLHEQSICELSDGTALPVGTVRRLACEANVIPICLNGDSERVDVGRQQRLANRAQRRALRAMYRRCGYPGCDVPFDRCDIHHVLAWERFFGRTDLANLLPLCVRHHHTVHEGGCTLTLDPDRTITLQRRDSTTAYQGDTTNRKPTAITRTGTHHLKPNVVDGASPSVSHTRC